MLDLGDERITPEMNKAKNLLRAAEEKKEKRKQVLKNRKATSPILMFMDSFKFVVVAVPCVVFIIYLAINRGEDVNAISLVITIMSAIIMMYSFLSGLLGKYRYMFLDVFYILFFYLGLVGAVFLGNKFADDGVKSLWISAICLCITMIIEMFKGIMFYVNEYKKKNKKTDEELNKIDSSGSFS